MKLVAALLFLALAVPVHAGVVWDESVNGELSHSFSTPTLIPLSIGSNIINGSIGNVDGKARDYLRVVLSEGEMLGTINLLVWTPDNTGFMAITEGVHSYFPSFETEGFYISGIHVTGADVGANLIDLFITRSVTSEQLYGPLILGSYCMVLQQTSPFLTTYSMEFILNGPVATEQTTWGAIKALYR